MSKLLKYAYGGQVNNMSGGAGAAPYAALATTALAAIPGGKATNDLKYTQMGASLAAINPIAGVVGAGLGLGADLIMGGKAKRDQKDLENQMAKNQFQALYGENGTLNPYAQPEGYAQTMQFADGGPVPPYRAKNKEDYNKRYQQYADSMLLHTSTKGNVELLKKSTGDQWWEYGKTWEGAAARKLNDAYHRLGRPDPSAEFSKGPNWAQEFAAPKQKILPPTVVLDRLDPRMPEGVGQGTPVSANVPSVPDPNYRFQGGFVDPRVAGFSTIRSEANRQVADPELTGYAQGGKAPVGHVIPVEKAREAVDDASKLGVDLSQNVIPGKGHPKADDKTIAPGGQPINVSSGEVYVDHNLFASMAKAVGMGVAEYQQRMYPNGHGAGYAEGGQIPPQIPPTGQYNAQYPDELSKTWDNLSLDPATIEQRNKQLLSRLSLDPATIEQRNARLLAPVKRFFDQAGGGGLDNNPQSAENVQAREERRLFQAHGNLKFQQDRLAKYMAGRNAPAAGTPPASTAAQPTGYPGFPFPTTAKPATPAVAGSALPGAKPKTAAAPRTPTADQVVAASTTASVLDAPRGETMDFMAANNADRSGPPRAEQIMPVLGPDLKPIPGSHTKNLNSGALASDPTNSTGTATAPGGEEAAAKSRGTDLDRLNNITGAFNTGLSLTSLAWNALSRRTPGIRPPALSLSRLNLDTDGLAAELDADRKAARATALSNSVNKQGMDRELGVLSADYKARTRNSMVVEGVENQERTANNQIENQERIYNNSQTQDYLKREVEAANNFKQMKGQAVSQSLAATAASVGGWMNNKVQIGAMGEMDDFASRYLKYQFGANETMRWDTDFLYFGDGRSTKRNFK